MKNLKNTKKYFNYETKRINTYQSQFMSEAIKCENSKTLITLFKGYGEAMANQSKEFQKIRLYHADGEKIEYLLKKIGMHKQMLRQLVMGADDIELENLIEEKRSISSRYWYLDGSEFDTEEKLIAYLRSLGDERYNEASDEYIFDEAYRLGEIKYI